LSGLVGVLFLVIGLVDQVEMMLVLREQTEEMMVVVVVVGKGEGRIYAPMAAETEDSGRNLLPTCEPKWSSIIGLVGETR